MRGLPVSKVGHVPLCSTLLKKAYFSSSFYSGNFDLQFTCTKLTRSADGDADGDLSLEASCEYKIYMNLMTVDIPKSECNEEGGTKKPIVPTQDGSEALCL